MRKLFRITLVTFMLLSLFGCSYDVTDPEFVEEYSEQNKLVTKVKYYEMSDGTWRTDTHTYKYRLEITGRMNGAAIRLTISRKRKQNLWL